MWEILVYEICVGFLRTFPAPEPGQVVYCAGHKNESDESILSMDKSVDWPEDPIIEVGTEVASKPDELLGW